jgi:hypothetical protein
MQDQTVAIHESKNSEKVVRFENLSNFKKPFRKAYDNGCIHGVYENKAGNVVAVDIWGGKIKKVIKGQR